MCYRISCSHTCSGIEVTVMSMVHSKHVSSHRSSFLSFFSEDLSNPLYNSGV